MERSYSPREAGRILGVTTHTIQVWDRQGKIRCIRLPTGRRRIPESEIRCLLNITEQRKEAIYARVSNSYKKMYIKIGDMFDGYKEGESHSQ